MRESSGGRLCKSPPTRCYVPTGGANLVVLLDRPVTSQAAPNVGPPRTSFPISGRLAGRLDRGGLYIGLQASCSSVSAARDHGVDRLHLAGEERLRAL